MAPLWRNQLWFSELSQLLTAAPWPIPLRRDLLSHGEQNNVASPSRAVGSAPLASRWELTDLPESVQNTISQARAPSTRRLYALKWSVFSAWCSTRGTDPFSCDISLILSFLQELLDKGCSPSTLKVYVAAIAASHAPIQAQVISLSTLPPSDEDQELNLLCHVRVLKIYLERFAPFRQSEQPHQRASCHEAECRGCIGPPWDDYPGWARPQ